MCLMKQSLQSSTQRRRKNVVGSVATLAQLSKVIPRNWLVLLYSDGSSHTEKITRELGIFTVWKKKNMEAMTSDFSIHLCGAFDLWHLHFFKCRRCISSSTPSHCDHFIWIASTHNMCLVFHGHFSPVTGRFSRTKKFMPYFEQKRTTDIKD